MSIVLFTVASRIFFSVTGSYRYSRFHQYKWVARVVTKGTSSFSLSHEAANQKKFSKSNKEKTSKRQSYYLVWTVCENIFSNNLNWKQRLKSSKIIKFEVAA